MASTRQELETRLAVFAASQTPPLAVCWENVPFTRPIGVPWLECYLISASTVAVTLAGTRNRERGSFAVNCWCPSGQGVSLLDALSAKVVAAFPVIPKTGNVSIEQPGNTSKLMYDQAGWVAISCVMPYRVETSTI